MKQFVVLVLLVAVFACGGHAQSKTYFLKQDTITLTSQNSNWLVPPEVSAKSKTMGAYLIDAIQRGKLKATDPETGQPIPAKDILSWKMQKDTVPQFDAEGNVSTYAVYQAIVDPEKITRIKVIQNWYLDAATGKLVSKPAYMLLYLEKDLPSGITVLVSFCRIDY